MAYLLQKTSVMKAENEVETGSAKSSFYIKKSGKVLFRGERHNDRFVISKDC